MRSLILVRNLALLSILLVAVLGSASCVTVEFEHDEFDDTTITNLTLLPIIDNRTTPNPEHDFAKMTEGILERSVKDLRKKGYEIRTTGDIGSVRSLTANDFEAADPEWVKALGPSNSKWVMVLTLAEVKSMITFGKSSTATAVAYLFNRETGELWWKARNKAKIGVGPLLAAFEDEERAATNATFLKLVKGFPRHRDKRERDRALSMDSEP